MAMATDLRRFEASTTRVLGFGVFSGFFLFCTGGGLVVVTVFAVVDARDVVDDTLCERLFCEACRN
jgi:hypothetical protein